MKLINPSAEIWEQDTSSPVEGMYAHIAKCTRVCYQSEKKNNDETEEEFVKRVILRHEPWNSEANHLAMLEHGTVYLYLETGPNNVFSKFEYPSAHFTAGYNWSDVVGHIRAKYKRNKYSKVNTAWLGKEIRGTFITTNLRVIYENNWLEDLQFVCSPSGYHAKRVTVSFTTNIGVTREFNRHRVNSIAEESTRYCNYHLDKFKNSITFTLPSWIDINKTEVQACRSAEIESDMYADMRINMELSDTWDTIDWYLYALSTSALAYKKLIKLGWKPQQAREVLPLATKTQLIHTAFVDDWKHFFALRADGVSGTPHPNAALVAKPLKEEFIKHGLL